MEDFKDIWKFSMSQAESFAHEYLFFKVSIYIIYTLSMCDLFRNKHLGRLPNSKTFCEMLKCEKVWQWMHEYMFYYSL